MKLTKVLMAMAISVLIGFTGCKPKDADIKAAIETKLKSDPEMSHTMVTDVKDGIATISGVCKDEACKAKCEQAVSGVKGVKSVINNSTIAPPPMAAAPVMVSGDEELTRNVMDAVKDYPTVKASVNDGIVTLTGDISKASQVKLMMMVQSLKPRKVENKLTVK